MGRVYCFPDGGYKRGLWGSKEAELVPLMAAVEATDITSPFKT